MHDDVSELMTMLRTLGGNQHPLTRTLDFGLSLGSALLEVLDDSEESIAARKMMVAQGEVSTSLALLASAVTRRLPIGTPWSEVNWSEILPLSEGNLLTKVMEGVAPKHGSVPEDVGERSQIVTGMLGRALKPSAFAGPLMAAKARLSNESEMHLEQAKDSEKTKRRGLSLRRPTA